MYRSHNKELEQAIIERNARIARKRYHKALYSRILKIVNSAERVLDIGCGYGNVTALLGRSSGFAVGVDVRDVFGRSYLSSSVDFCCADALKLPFPDNTFDCVVSLDVIEHIADHERFIREAHRVLKRYGTFIMETPNRHRLSVRLLSLLHGGAPIFPKCYGKDPVLGPIVHVREYTKEELLKLFLRCGFAQVDILGLWLGFVTPEVGIENPPKSLERLGQSWMVVTVKYKSCY